MQNLDEVIQVVIKTCVDKKEFKLDAQSSTLAHFAMEQQGVARVIKILEAIRDRTLDVREIMKKE